MTKQYASNKVYDQKLTRVMERFNATDVDSDWTRKGSCWIRFTIDGEAFYFTHSVEQAQAAGIKITEGSDAFAQLVLTLEDLARANERGTFKLKKVLGAMAMLEPPKEIPQCFKDLGFDRIPTDDGVIGAYSKVVKQYRSLSQTKHPDNGGSDQAFKDLTQARDDAVNYLKGM